MPAERVHTSRLGRGSGNPPGPPSYLSRQMPHQEECLAPHGSFHVRAIAPGGIALALSLLFLGASLLTDRGAQPTMPGPGVWKLPSSDPFLSIVLFLQKLPVPLSHGRKRKKSTVESKRSLSRFNGHLLGVSHPSGPGDKQGTSAAQALVGLLWGGGADRSKLNAYIVQ